MGLSLREISEAQYVKNIQLQGQTFSEDGFYPPSKTFNPVFTEIIYNGEVVGWRSHSFKPKKNMVVSTQFFVKQEYRKSTKQIIQGITRFYLEQDMQFRARILNRMLKFYDSMKDIEYKIIETNERNTLIEPRIKFSALNK